MVRSSSFPKVLGLCANQISDIAAYVNEAQERLIMDPLTPDEGWWGGWVTMAFNVTVTTNGTCSYAYVVTPREVARLIGIDVCQNPIQIRNGFYEYLQFGKGLQPNTQQCCGIGCGSSPGSGEAFERDNVVTLSAFIGSARQLRFYPVDPADVGKRMLVRGNDQNGIPVTGIDVLTQQAISGEYVYLAQPFADTVNFFTPPLTGLDKEITVGRVTVMSLDPVTGVETPLSSMEPGEVTSSYRRYLLNGLPRNCCTGNCGIVAITAQAKLDFVAVISDPDYLLIQSLPALIEEAQAIRYSRMDSPSAANLETKHHTKALSILNGQLDHYEGKTSTSVRVPIFGSDRMRTQPL